MVDEKSVLAMHIPNGRKMLKWAAIFLSLFLIILASPAIYLIFHYASNGVKGYFLTPQGSCVDGVFDPTKSGNSIACEVELSGESAYQISLSFAWPRNDKQERVRIANLIAPATRKSDGTSVGSPLHLQLTIKRDNGEMFLSKELVSPVSHSGGDDFIHVELLLKRFTAGKYLIEVKSMKDAPELADIPARIKIWPFLSN